MSKTSTTGGADKPMRPMTDDEVMAAALSDPTRNHSLRLNSLG